MSIIFVLGKDTIIVWNGCQKTASAIEASSFLCSVMKLKKKQKQKKIIYNPIEVCQIIAVLVLFEMNSLL